MATSHERSAPPAPHPHSYASSSPTTNLNILLGTGHGSSGGVSSGGGVPRYPAPSLADLQNSVNAWSTGGRLPASGSGTGSAGSGGGGGYNAMSLLQAVGNAQVLDPALASSSNGAGPSQLFSHSSGGTSAGGGGPYNLPPIRTALPNTTPNTSLAPLLHAAAAADYTPTSPFSSSSFPVYQQQPLYGQAQSPAGDVGIPTEAGAVSNRENGNGVGAVQGNGKRKVEDTEGGQQAAQSVGGGGKSPGSGDGEGRDEEIEEGEVGPAGDGRTLKNTRRAAQNRAAQRAFRERKEQYVRDLERKSTMLDETVARERDLSTRLAAHEALVASFAHERHAWTREREAYQSERAGWLEKEARWGVEREGWKFSEGEWRRECEGLRGALDESRRQNTELRVGKQLENVEDGKEQDEERKEVEGTG